ncbi:MAG: hypothetical protein U5K76_11170 [Woeseiaceae bacterium]|nr:hypothetical protein [Woeseiaceae bacterium]
MTDRMDGPLARAIRAATKVEPHEIRATVLSFAFIFLLMAAYFILRPVRDAMSSEWGDAELSWLWTSTFVFSILAVIIYGAIIPRVRVRNLVPGVYAFFAASFVAFYLGAQLADRPVWVDKAFYVWLSVFSLFHVSVFWSFIVGPVQQAAGAAAVRHYRRRREYRRARRPGRADLFCRRLRHDEPDADRRGYPAAADSPGRGVAETEGHRTRQRASGGRPEPAAAAGTRSVLGIRRCSSAIRSCWQSACSSSCTSS